VEASSLLDLLQDIQVKCKTEEENIRRSLRLSPAEYAGLRVISPEEEITCQEFSRRMGLSLSRGSRVIDRLAHHGYLRRTGCLTDRRCKSLRLTQKGKTHRSRIAGRRRECEDRLRTAYSPSTWKALKYDMKHLLKNL